MSEHRIRSRFDWPGRPCWSEGGIYFVYKISICMSQSVAFRPRCADDARRQRQIPFNYDACKLMEYWQLVPFACFLSFSLSLFVPLSISLSIATIDVAVVVVSHVRLGYFDQFAPFKFEFSSVMWTVVRCDTERNKCRNKIDVCLCKLH